MNTRERETAIEDRLSRASAANYGGDREVFDLARDLVRCWREYLRAVDDARAAANVWTIQAAMLVAEEHVATARALLARGDAQ